MNDTINVFKIIKWNGELPDMMIQFTYILGKTPNNEVDPEMNGTYNVFIRTLYDPETRWWNNEYRYPCNLSNLTDSLIDKNIKCMF